MTDHTAALRDCAELFQQIADALVHETGDLLRADPRRNTLRALALQGGDRCVEALWRQDPPAADPLKALLGLARDIKRSADDTPGTVLAQQRTLAAKGIQLAEQVIALQGQA